MLGWGWVGVGTPEHPRIWQLPAEMGLQLLSLPPRRSAPLWGCTCWRGAVTLHCNSNRVGAQPVEQGRAQGCPPTPQCPQTRSRLWHGPHRHPVTPLSPLHPPSTAPPCPSSLPTAPLTAPPAHPHSPAQAVCPAPSPVWPLLCSPPGPLSSPSPPPTPTPGQPPQYPLLGCQQGRATPPSPHR